MIADFYAFQAELEQRKRELGIELTEADTDALRNKGGSRSVGKKALLEEISRRADPDRPSSVRSYF